MRNWTCGMRQSNAERRRRKNMPVLANLETGKLAAISIFCPHCGASQTVNLKSPEETCNRCGTTYLIPKEALGLVLFEK